jgi:uncharacterized membrane protein YgdD (TMEM256/DUF423 family)
MRSPWLLIGAVLAGLAVAAGAFGAHALRDRLTPPHAGWYDLAVRYQMYHGLALVALGAMSTRRVRAGAAAGCLLAGTLIFCGTLYLMALADLRWLGAVTPIGGTLLLIGWLVLAIAAGRRRGFGQ